MYTAIAQTGNINIEASSLLLEKQEAQRRDLIHIISFTNASMIYKKYSIISSLHYTCLLNEFSDITMIKVLAVRIPHAEATI